MVARSRSAPSIPAARSASVAWTLAERVAFSVPLLFSHPPNPTLRVARYVPTAPIRPAAGNCPVMVGPPGEPAHDGRRGHGITARGGWGVVPGARLCFGTGVAAGSLIASSAGVSLAPVPRTQAMQAGNLSGALVRWPHITAPFRFSLVQADCESRGAISKGFCRGAG